MKIKDKIAKLLRAVKAYHLGFAVNTMGREMLSKNDMLLLNEFGIRTKPKDQFKNMFQLGLASVFLEKFGHKVRKMKKEEYDKKLEEYDFIPLNQEEEDMLFLIKTQSLGRIKRLGENVGTGIAEKYVSREAYEQLIRDEASKVVRKKQTRANMVSNIGNLTKDWGRDINRLVETEMHIVQQEGIIRGIIREYGIDSYVYKDVYPKACKYCIKHYLTGGIGSEPKKFKIQDIYANGMDNASRRVDDWLPVVGAMHPYCRCHLMYYDKKYDWDPDTNSYSKFKPNQKRRGSKIKITIER